jgi:hypothetical protein
MDIITGFIMGFGIGILAAIFIELCRIEKILSSDG